MAAAKVLTVEHVCLGEPSPCGVTLSYLFLK